MIDLPGRSLRCRVDECGDDEGCHVDLSSPDSPEVVVLSMDCLRKISRHSGDICDYSVIFTQRQIVTAIELKGGKNLPIERAVAQINGGTALLLALLDGQKISEFYPILAYHSRDPIPSLSDLRITFRKTVMRVLAYPCGTRLTTILSEVSPRSRTRRES
jgi:hypothetical protein